VAAGVLLTLVVTRDSNGGGSASAVDDVIAHVHGLGINPADDKLYVATHHGVYRLSEDGAAAQVGDREQDTMGFTVAGPDRFLASGHPDNAGFQAGQPPLLGLIESADGGVTWSSLSLLGDADFHALAFAHGRVYGADSSGSRFLVSTDRSEWETRSTIVLRSLAVDPQEPERIVAAADNGPVRSDNGGRTWAPLDAPALAVVAWAASGSLYGLDISGTLHRSADGGATWARRGALRGQPQALLAGDVLYAAAADEEGRTSIYRSDDEGSSWDRVYPPAG
jgi:hypothetical protein